MTFSLLEVEDKIKLIAQEGYDRAESLLKEIAPVVHDGATTLQQLTSSKIVSEVMQYGEDILPADVVDAVVTIIRGAGEAASKIAQLSAPAAEPASEPAQEAQPQ